MATANARFTGLLVNNTGQDIRGIFETALRDANGTVPAELEDIFTVREYFNGDERRLIVDMIED